MPLQKQPIALNFGKGLSQKSDPYQLPMDSFTLMQNSVFDKAGRLTKRNGYPIITTLPNTDQTTLTTINGNLLATGSNLYAYSQESNQWLNQGSIQPVALEVLPLVRVSTGQTGADSAVSSAGLVCLAYMDNSVAYYQISDGVTGQQILGRTSLGSASINPRVFILGQYFIVTFMRTVAATPTLQYIAIPIATPTTPNNVATIDSVVVAITSGYDGIVANNTLYLGWAGTAVTLRMKGLNSTLNLSGAITLATTDEATLVSLSADSFGATPVIWVSFWVSATNNGFTAAFNQNLLAVLVKTQIITGIIVKRLSSYANNQVMELYYEVDNAYAYDAAIKSDYIASRAITQAGVLASAVTLLRSVGLASKPFSNASGAVYMLVAYGDSNTNQPTYFLTDNHGNIYMRLAATNGGGYQASQVLPSVSLVGTQFMAPYQIKDFLATVNKTTPIPAGNVSAIYTQTGINLAKISINNKQQYSSEIAGALHLTGGQLWEYDGVKPVEHGFQVYPENVEITTATGAGNLIADTYYYQFTYEWTDNAGNLHRSAPSLPVKQVTTTASSTNTIKVPTLRLTYKVGANPVRIVGYRWSVLQQVYYQFTSITSPTLNDITVDYVTITDTFASTAILGQTLLYTTGGVVENIAAPACIHSCLFKNRLVLIDAEDPNLLWYSKQVIQNVPVEMSDLFTEYVAPTSGAQGSTGPMKCLSAMDDKLIIFKKDAAYYLTGSGPDITGANNDFNDPVYISSSVGCANPNSLVLTPDGIMFQSDKGIWLLDRGLNTSYIGAPVEDYNANTVLSAETIPGTNQVRFILDNSVTLMYDYYYKQWGTFTNTTAISGTLYQGYHSYLNTLGQVFQEAPNTYIDGTSPVLMSVTTAWMSMAGLQGYERFYFANLLGTYYTPFKLSVQIAYDYNQAYNQAVVVTPDNYTPIYGNEPLWGSGETWGGQSNVFSARIFPEKQKCESFQITIQEVYDSSFGVAAGAGLTLSGLAMVVGVKKGFRTQSAAKSFG